MDKSRHTQRGSHLRFGYSGCAPVHAERSRGVSSSTAEVRRATVHYVLNEALTLAAELESIKEDLADGEQEKSPLS